MGARHMMMENFHPNRGMRPMVTRVERTTTVKGMKTLLQSPSDSFRTVSMIMSASGISSIASWFTSEVMYFLIYGKPPVSMRASP